MLYRVHLVWAGFELTTLVVISTDCIHVGSYKSNYHTIMTTTSLKMQCTRYMHNMGLKQHGSSEHVASRDHEFPSDAMWVFSCDLHVSQDVNIANIHYWRDFSLNIFKTKQKIALIMILNNFYIPSKMTTMTNKTVIE